MTNAVTVARLHEVLRYDAEVGALYWRERPGNQRFNSRYAGKRAFTAIQSAGYPHGTVDGVFLLAHRVAWAMHCGQWPSDQVDHISGNRADFSIQNLREADQSENLKNAGISSRNTSGMTGISFNKASGKWAAYISAVQLGLFGCKTAAALARKTAEIKAGYHPNHGRAAQC